MSVAEYKVAKETARYVQIKEELEDVEKEIETLKEDNVNLRESLKKAYDFMEKIVIDGRNMLESFVETLTKATERVIDEWRTIRR